MIMFPFLRSARFWAVFLVTGALLVAFFAWELGMLPLLPVLPRPQATLPETMFTASLVLLLALNAGLLAWQQRFGSCPRGARRASGIGGLIGAFALLCPVCLVLPLSLLGAGVGIAVFAPFIPILRIIALLILIVSTVVLWPRNR